MFRLHSATHGVEDQARFSISRLPIDICTALAHIHVLAVMHKDIKEDNIFVRCEGQRSHAQFILADFGFAEAVAQRAPSTRHWWLVSADRYRAPELYFASKSSLHVVRNEIVFRPGGYVDADVMLHPIDLWSFGVVCCSCFLNVYPVTPIDAMAGYHLASPLFDLSMF